MLLRSILALLIVTTARAGQVAAQTPTPVLRPAATFTALRERSPGAHSSKQFPSAQPSTANRVKLGAAPDTTWPEGTQLVPFENLEGMVLIDMTLRGAHGRDTTGLFVLDTGAGFLALDHALAATLGI